MDNYGGSADQLVIMQIVTYNGPRPTKDQSALEVVAQKLEELVKKEPATLQRLF